MKLRKRSLGPTRPQSIYPEMSEVSTFNWNLITSQMSCNKMLYGKQTPCIEVTGFMVYPYIITIKYKLSNHLTVFCQVILNSGFYTTIIYIFFFCLFYFQYLYSFPLSMPKYSRSRNTRTKSSLRDRHCDAQFISDPIRPPHIECPWPQPEVTFNLRTICLRIFLEKNI